MSPSKRHFLFIIIVLIAAFIFQSDAPLGDLFADNQGENIVGMGNPSAVYCQEMGYQYRIVSDERGESGICQLPDDTICDAWSFLQGECGQEYGYCSQQGLETVVKHDGKNSLTQTYAVCVDEDQVEQGNVVEMLELDQKSLGCGVGLEEASPLDLAEAEPAQPLDFDPPASFDWRNYLGGDWLTPIRNQGICGSCWSFAAVGVTESVLNIAEGDPTYDSNLSEQYLVSDCQSIGGYQNCCGGWKDQALAYIVSQGIPDDSCMPYVDGTGGTGCSCGGGTCDVNCTYRTSPDCSDTACSDRCADWNSQLVTIQSSGGLGYNASDNTIKQYLVDYGPLAVSVGIGSSVGGGFNGDIYECSSSDTNHAVVIVGYEDAGSYWIVRNSWGTWNGDGYYKLGYGECGVNKYVYYADDLAPEIDLQGNGLSISSGDFTPSLTDHTDFGSAAITGGTITRTFTIENTGGANLNLTDSPQVTISGTHAADFSVTSQPSSPVASGGGTTTFQVQFDPGNTGLREAAISIANSDIDENPYNFAIQGTGLAPEMDVQGDSQSIPDGDLSPSLTDHTDFGSTNVFSGAITRTFTIENSGSAELNLTGSPELIEITGTHASDFTVTLDPTSPVPASGGTTTFQVQFDPSNTGLREATISIANSDIDENPYNFAIQGTGISPEMDVQGNGQSIPDGDLTPSLTDHTDFGSINVSVGEVTRTFTIENSGSAELNLTGSPELIEITGTHASDFTVTLDPTSPVPASGGTTTFQVSFNSSDIGLREATISIENNDIDENPYTFAVQGTGTITFSDVLPSYWAFDWIEALYQSGLTGGCSVNPLMYCPENTVTRAQMAVFLEKGIHGAGFFPPDVPPTFGDTAGHWAEDWIEALRDDGITSGCGGGNYCPNNGTTRAQMAVFLLRSKHGAGYLPPDVSPTFGDTAGHWAEDWIEQLASEGITAGCGGGNYCPDNPVTRAQMAVFLVRTFNLPMP